MRSFKLHWIGLLLALLSVLAIAEEEAETVSPLAIQFASDLEQVAELKEGNQLEVFAAKRLSAERACWRNLKARHGRVPTKSSPCDTQKEVKENGICYEHCSPSYEGIGPMCFSQCRCKLGYRTLFFCCDDKDVCSGLIAQMVTKLPLEIVQLIVDLTSDHKDPEKVISDFRALLETIIDLMMPTCDKEIPSGCANNPVEQLTGGIQLEL